jgi:hypothetical protein
MRNCRSITRLISDGLDRSLTVGERLRLGVHLLGCPPCRRFRRACRYLREILPAPTEDRLPADARNRIQRALETAAGDE